MPNILGEIRYAGRVLGKHPAFTAIAALTLALGIGANTAIFSVVNAVLLRPLPYPHSEQLVTLRERLFGPFGFESGSVSYLNFLDWRAAQHSLTDLALVRHESVNLSGADSHSPPQRITAARITYNYFSVLGVPPQLGRDLLETDDLPGAHKVMLISERLWRTRFGALPLVPGQTLNVDGVPREIIGVASGNVQFPHNADVFLPLADLRKDHDFLSRGNHEAFTGLGRLKPNVTLRQAIAELDTIAADLARRYPDSNTGRQVSAKLFLDFSVGEYRPLLYLLLAAVGCVLLIACANVANLQLARGISRRKEIAVRAALGASRWQLARPFLIEAGLLAILGGGCAVLMALWSLDTIRALAPSRSPRFQQASIDSVVLLATTGIIVLAGLFVGVWPALRISSNVAMANEVHDNAGRASDGARWQRARSILVVAQVALAVVLLSAAGVTLKSFWRAQQIPLGFNPQGVLSMTIALPASHYNSPDNVVRFYNQLLDKAKVLPGVSAAALCSNAPFDHNEWDSSFHVTNTPPDPPGKEPVSEMSLISPDFFKVLGMPLLRGRPFGEQDTIGHPGVVIIDEQAAARFFPGQDPMGRQIDDPVTIGQDSKKAVPLTIVGIVPHTRNDTPGGEIDLRHLPMMYFPATQFTQNEQNLMVRAAPGYDPHSLVDSIKQQITSLDSDQAVSDVATMEENIGDSLAPRRLTITLLGVFAALALGLASIGLYGVMALTVSQRTRELGIRLALGAHRADIFRLVLGQGMLLVGIGLLIGVLAAASAGRGLASILYQVSVWDTASFVSAIFTLALVAMIACWLPALRATRVDPIEALRSE